LCGEFHAREGRNPNQAELERMHAERQLREAEADKRRAEDAERRRAITAGETAPLQIRTDEPWPEWQRPHPSTLERAS
jgi:hypothetical protein